MGAFLRWTAIAVSMLLAVGLVAGLAIADPLAPGPEPQPDRRPLIGDDGSYAGVGIGDSARAVQGRFGACRSSDGATWPLGYDRFAEDAVVSGGSPGPIDAPSRFLRCQLASFGLVRNRIYTVEVVDSAAETPRGVGRGDALARAREVYPEIRCEIQNAGTEYTSFPQCRGRLRPGLYVWFGDDPISLISYSTEPFDCGGDCPPWAGGVAGSRSSGAGSATAP